MSIIEHFTYEAACAELKAELDDFRPGGIVFLIGPSGAGKTTLRHAVMQEMFGKPDCWGTGRIPAIETISRMPNNAYFSSRDLAKRLLRELHVPSLKWLTDGNSSLDPSVKARLEAEVENARHVWSQLRPQTMTEADYWDVVEESLRARGCKYVSIEQATGLLKNHRDTSPADHTLNLMSLAESAGVMFIMTGVSKASELWGVHHELRRRVGTVWFRPYGSKIKDDRLHYLRLLKTISPRYKLSKPNLLGLMADDLMSATGGLLGHLITILDKAKRKARAAGSRCITGKHVRDSFYSDRDMDRVWLDVHDFESVCSPGNVAQRTALLEAQWQRSSADAAPSSAEDD